MEIRRERPDDHGWVAQVHRAAFAPLYDAGAEPPEVALVDELRRGPWWLPALSLVALSGEGTVVGHVLATRATLEPTGAPALGLAPLGVDPRHQGRGVGSALMHAILAAAEARDEPLVALLGEPAYYRRFGFVPASEHGVASPDPAWGAAFQARVLRGPAIPGTFRYAPPFDRLG